MADAKITIETLADNKELKGLNDALAEGTQKLKDMQKELKNMEKDANADEEAMAKLRSEIQMQKVVNQQYAKAVKNTANELTNAAKSATDSKSAFSNLSSIISDKLGFDITNLNLSLTGLVGAFAAVAGALISAGRDVSAFSNQFKTFAGSVQGAEEMYNMFNETYRNTNYDEQKVYDMAKGLLAVGINAKEANEIIMECADTSASLGKGVEFCDELTAAFKRLATGGELTEKQYKAIAEAGIDLTDVQEQMRAGGETAYEALKQKLKEYEGGMNSSKQTAAEMEGDIKGNLVEIGRQTAILVDDFFGFSDMLREFYQWVIDTTASVISSIKGMISALRNAKAEGDAYAAANEEWEANYHDIWEEKRNEYRTEEEWEAARALAVSTYCNATADVVVETEKQKQDAIAETIALQKKQVKSIAGGGASASGGGSSGGGGGSSGGSTAKAVDPAQEAAKQLAASIQAEDTLHKLKMAHMANEEAQGLITHEEYMAQKQAELEDYKAKLQERLDSDAITNEQRLSAEQALQSTLQALQTKTTDTQVQNNQKVQQYYQNMAKTFASSMTNCIMNAENFGDAFKQIIQQIIQQLIQAAIYAAIVAAFTGGGGGFGARFSSNFKGALGMASGGPVVGPGTGTSDTAGLYALSNGEYVLNAAAVDRIGVANLNRINNAGHMASGGTVSGGSVGNSVTLNVSAMDASGFGDFLSRGGLDSIKQALFEDDRMFAANSGTF